MESLIEDEWYIVRNSGEIPEIAYNSSIYFLERAKDGPGVQLSPEQKTSLQQAALARCEEIVLRDMFHHNVGLSIYRGVARSICNYERFLKFCDRQSLESESLRKKAAEQFLVFLDQEYQNVILAVEPSVINCSYSELERFANLLVIDFPSQYRVLEDHCLQEATVGE